MENLILHNPESTPNKLKRNSILIFVSKFRRWVWRQPILIAVFVTEIKECDNFVYFPLLVSFAGTTKKELLVVVQLNKPEVRYQLDDYVAKCTDHEIVRLPPYHSIYNPIEMVWSQMKRYYDKNIGRNNDYSHEMAETIWAEALACVSIQQWENYCRHTETRILEDYAREVSDDCNREAYQIQIVCDEDDADNGDDDGADADNFTAMQVTVDLDSRIHNSASLEMNLGSVRRSLLTAFESEMLADPPQSDEDMVAGLQMETDFADHSVLPAIPSSDSTNCSPRTLDHVSSRNLSDFKLNFGP
ncbi:uncharacterized protein LOC135167158 [Diachasmimorpha longicaudata]|uniref:uncharacterized protein LOC135167158 n=1 Tax=Diachasmimorpha longicaudata TaxID=58733 RepID=UPI0030B8EB81